MIENPEKYVLDFLKSGANFLTVHFEACSQASLNQIIKTVHDFGAKIGIAIKPKTNVEEISNWLSIVDLVLVMSVEPGFAGQSFIPSALEKIKNLDLLRKKNSYSYLIEVDGGINEKTIHDCSLHGCNIFVAGSAIFNSNDYKNTIQNLKSKL
jgi:ribulose-phosphate 3-epimerase